MSDATENLPSLPSELSEQSDATLQATLNAAAAAAAAAAAQQQSQQDANEEGKVEQDGEHGASNDANYFDYSFPATSAALDADGNPTVSTSFPFATHPHPQHPHLGVEALGHAAAASEHIPGVTAEGEENHIYDNTNGADHSMEMTMTTNAEDSVADHAQQERSSGKAGRASVAASDGTGEGKKNTPYSRSPDMRNSHKLAERKRRKEMKDLFDELRDEIPNERGPKTSKWEILQKAVEYVRALRKERDEYASEVASYRGDTTHQDESMVGADEPQPPPEAPEGADEYAKYEEQQAMSQQQLEAAAAAANQFYEGAEHQDGDYKAQEGEEIQQEESEAIAEQTTDQDWSAIAAQAQTA